MTWPCLCVCKAQVSKKVGATNKIAVGPKSKVRTYIVIVICTVYANYVLHMQFMYAKSDCVGRWRPLVSPAHRIQHPKSWQKL